MSPWSAYSPEGPLPPALRNPSAHAWQVLYPPLQSHARGWLAVGDGHEIYWEQAGNPLGQAALVVHGGPGAGCRPDDRRWFDPQRWRIVLFDQRGCGRSRPPGRCEGNHTEALIEDIEALRRHLGIDRWLLFGGSWGSTLALAYAQRHPDRVSAMVLRGVYTARRTEREWLYTPHGAASQVPGVLSAWQALCSTAGTRDGMDLLEALQTRLTGVGLGAARAWWQWEQSLMQHELPPSPSSPASGQPGDAQLLVQARIGVHYACHAGFLEEGQLLRDAGQLQGIPGVIVQGQRDLVTPAATAEALAQAWPGVRLELLPQAGHASSHPEMARALVEAVDNC